ncbi:MAG: glycosyltransferase family A protein [Solirubrobacteraceae bacterium]
MSGHEPVLTVALPTRNRAATLARCLAALEPQARETGSQIVVVDDASSDDTAAVLAARPDVEARRRPEPGGIGTARNDTVDLARAPIVLFVDDDVIAAPGLLERHLAHHARHPEPNEALGGRVTWSPEVTVTRHMHWLENGGPLFAFNAIPDPQDVEWRHFCTANVSVKRSFLGPRPFDGEMERYSDPELAYRLAARGLRLRYNAAALGHHLRSDTPESTERRMRLVGRAARTLHAKHPELAEPPPPFTALSHLKAAAARAANPLLHAAGVHALDERIFSYRAARAFAQGYAERDREPAKERA